MEHPIRRLRRERGLRQKDVADTLGYTPTFISDLERGADKCGREAALKIWRAYGIPLEELLTWSPEDAA